MSNLKGCAAGMPSLTANQHIVYDVIIDAYATNKGRVVFIDGLAGTDKTYVENLILKIVGSCGNIALLLQGGCTPHLF